MQDVLDCRLIDLTVAHPDWRNAAADAVLEAMAAQAPLPILYVGCQGNLCYWDYDQIHDMLDLLEGRPDMLVYPGASIWVEAAQGIAEAFR